MLNKPMSDLIGMQKSKRNFKSDNKWVLPECHIGVELELENAEPLRLAVQKNESMWSVVTDDSLRNDGYEFLFSEPLSGMDLSSSLDYMNKVITELKKKGERYSPDPHYRGSIHVHVDVRDCTIPQYMNLVLLAILFEPCLFKLAGEHRARNNFSMSSRFSTGYFESLSLAYNARTFEGMSSALRNQFKYSAINVTPPFMNEERNHPRKGSLEFRHHEASDNMLVVERWINVLMCLKKAALTQNLFSPEWMSKLSSGGLRGIMEEIFGRYTPYLLYANMEEDCIEGARLVQEVIYLSRGSLQEQLISLDAELSAKVVLD